MTLYDVAIVGSGIACSMTLCQLEARLKEKTSKGKTLRIAVIEKEAELWNGVPYGRRSTMGALTFQRLQEFLEEPERSQYAAWLTANADSWLNTFLQHGGLSAAQWLSDNRSLMESGRWGEMYLPRFLFGLYISSHTARAVTELSRTGLATVTMIRGEATAISKISERLHVIAVQDGSGGSSEIQAARIVLAIGSPPQRTIHRSAAAARLGHTHISDVYSPSEDASIQRIKQTLACVPDKSVANILIVGSNASALEVLYLLNYRPEIRDLINSVVVLSYGGMLPYKICEQTIDFELTSLRALGQSDSFSAARLMEAISCDIRRAEQLGLNIADLRDPVGIAVGQLMPRMHVSEQKRFVCEHGASYSRLMRRAGPDTCNAARELTSLGILSTVKGEFRRLEPHPLGNGLMSAVYASPERQGEATHPMPFCITINCGGFEELDLCSSPLLNSLMRNNVCTANSTKRGFLVSEHLEASENVYVIGPLVAGNFNDKVRFWHVESASRILGLAKLLAESLAQSLISPETHSPVQDVGFEHPASSSTYLPCL